MNDTTDREPAGAAAAVLPVYLLRWMLAEKATLSRSHLAKSATVVPLLRASLTVGS